MKKLSLIIAGGALLFGCGVNAYAANIGLVNVAKILQTSSKVKSVNEAIENKLKPEQAKLAAQDKVIQAESQKLARNKSVMSAADQKKLQMKITNDKQDFVKDAEAFQEKVASARNEAMQKIVKELNSDISMVAKKQSLDMVLFSQAVAYSGNATDITSDVADAFNKS